MEQIPLTESLLDCMERTFPLWENKIQYELLNGRNVLVVAHANTLRGLVKTIDNIGDAEIQDISIPTGIPIIYKFDKDMKSVPPSKTERAVSQVHMNGLFLEKPGVLKEALKREDEWRQMLSGYDSTMSRHKTPMSSLERSLYKLEAERELGEWASEFIDSNAIPEDDGSDGNMGRPIKLTEDELWKIGMEELENGSQFDPDSPTFHQGKTDSILEEEEEEEEMVPVPLWSTNPCVTSMPSEMVLNHPADVPIRRDSVIVIIRHGKTQHNKLGLFTGWEDAPLADEGIEEAKLAGRLLKMHGFEFDVVYTSWLSRALETALYVMDEMDALWLPIIKTWRLNERMYGELTGLSKQMVKQRHGEKQFKAWRRGFNVRPPPVSSFSQHYPGNDPRYQKYLKDRRISVRESVIRSIEKGSPVIQRKLPKTESLKDCMDRTIPYFKERIAKEAVDQGKRVLISSSENAIRGLLMHLCEIPQEEITDLEIPNGLPLIFDVKSKCLKLLDDGTGRDPLEVYNFGKAAKYLFRPCQNEDGSPDEVSFQVYGIPFCFFSINVSHVFIFVPHPLGMHDNV
jgi:2,3-bisphosphoglycerate-dependent phosphoglycerate mutase